MDRGCFNETTECRKRLIIGAEIVIMELDEYKHSSEILIPAAMETE